MTLQEWDEFYKTQNPETTLEELQRKADKRDIAKKVYEVFGGHAVIPPTDEELKEARN